MAVVKVLRLANRGAKWQQRTQQMRNVAAIDLGDFAHDIALASGMSVTEASRKVVKDAAVQTLQLAQTYAPRGETGALRQSIHIEYSDDGMTAHVGPDTEYDAYVEFGTGLHNELLPVGARQPYVIEPKKPGGVLRFTAKDGTVVFTKRVIHPGIKAQPYMRPAAERVADAFARGIGDAGVKIIVQGSK